ncbi:MAG: ABC transporter permease [Lachnospiraceae bacterium]|nr:ABC transporter permease [Lachnospiraceae bacterium]
MGKFKNIDNLSLLVMRNDKDIPNDFSHYSFLGEQNMVFYEENYITGAGLRVTDANYPDLFEKFFDEGHKISNSGNECIVGKRIKDMYDIAVGDKMVIGNKVFTVCGITAENLDSGHILINDSDAVDVVYPRLYFFDDSKVPPNFVGDGNLYVHNEIEKHFNMSDDNKKASREVIGICVTVLLYSLVSIYSIHMFYMEKKAVTTYVCYCTGVSRKTYFTQNLFENLIVSTSGAIIAYLSALLLKIPLKSFNLYEFDFPIYTLLVVLVFALLTSIFLAAKSVRKMK